LGTFGKALLKMTKLRKKSQTEGKKTWGDEKVVGCTTEKGKVWDLH